MTGIYSDASMTARARPVRNRRRFDRARWIAVSPSQVLGPRSQRRSPGQSSGSADFAWVSGLDLVPTITFGLLQACEHRACLPFGFPLGVAGGYPEITRERGELAPQD